MDSVFWITTIGILLSFGAWIFYYASLGKRISNEEKIAERDLTYETNPFAGSSQDATKNNKK